MVRRAILQTPRTPGTGAPSTGASGKLTGTVPVMVRSGHRADRDSALAAGESDRRRGADRAGSGRSLWRYGARRLGAGENTNAIVRTAGSAALPSGATPGRAVSSARVSARTDGVFLAAAATDCSLPPTPVATARWPLRCKFGSAGAGAESPLSRLQRARSRLALRASAWPIRRPARTLGQAPRCAFVARTKCRTRLGDGPAFVSARHFCNLRAWQ